MQGSRFFGSDEWFAALRKQIFDDMENKCFWEKALNKDDLDESRRSHIDRHIGKTASDLIQRGFAEISLKNNAPDTFLSSTFNDAATLEARLEDCLTTMLLFSPDEFCALAEAAPDTRMSLLAAVDPISWAGEFDVMQPCIVMGYDGRLREEKTNVVRIVFRRAPQAPYGFHIVTAYPDASHTDQRFLAGRERNPTRGIVERTGRDLTPDLENTLHYKESGTVRRAFLRAAADMSMPHCIEKIGYSNGGERYAPSFSVMFSSRCNHDKCIAYISERKTTVNLRSSKGPAEKLDLSNFEDWDRVHRINDQAARFVEKIGETLQANSGFSSRKSMKAKAPSLAFSRQPNRPRQSSPPR